MYKQNIKRFLASLYPPVYKNGVIILNYHSVGPKYEFSLHPREFERQMKFIKRNYEVIALDQIANTATRNVKIVITFDDGFEDNWKYAYPILKKLDLPATIFIITDFVLNGHGLNKDWPYYRELLPLKTRQIKQMLRHKISIGSHSQTHRQMSSLGRSGFIAELKESKRQIDRSLTIKTKLFAFPFGQGKDQIKFKDAVFSKIGYQFVCTTSWGINRAFNLNTTALKRIRIDHFDTIGDFKDKLRGKWDFVGLFQKLLNLL